MNPIVEWLSGKNNMAPPRKIRRGYNFDEVSEKIANKYKEHKYVLIMYINPDENRDDNMDMAFWVSMKSSNIRGYYPKTEIFDHENDYYLDAIVFPFDTLDEKGCLDEQWSKKLKQWHIYPFVIHPLALQNEIIEWVKTLNFDKVTTYDLGHDLMMDFYEVYCP